MFFVYILLFVTGIALCKLGIGYFFIDETSKDFTYPGFFYPSDFVGTPLWLKILFGIIHFIPGVYVIMFSITGIAELVEDRIHNKKIDKQQIPRINLDKIPYDDIEWIEEIKLRKKRGDKMVAYSSKGEAAARRKAKALGLEDCFVKFLSEEEVKKQRGW